MRNESVLSLVATCLLTVQAHAALVPQPDLWPYWKSSNSSSIASLDHSAWQQLLDRYLVVDTADGINRFRYGDVSAADRQALQNYTDSLSAYDPRVFNRSEQQAYWINLYNALTVALVIDNYPVKSIRRINDGLLSLGPWNDEIVEVQRKLLSLNDIEHRILRPIFGDPRVHYAVNCASLGCPNLAAQAYTGEGLDEQLTAAARAYVQHQRGVNLQDNKLRVSSIYKWFAVDFGDGEAGLLEHLSGYADEPLKSALLGYDGRIKYDYDWVINGP
jgi:hypothetical protein